MDGQYELENIYMVAIEDDEVRKTLLGLKDELTAPENKVFKSETIVYLEACFDYAISNPSSFRHHCYSFKGMVFFSHQKDKKGKLTSVKAMYEDEYRYLRRIGKIAEIAQKWGVQ